MLHVKQSTKQLQLFPSCTFDLTGGARGDTVEMKGARPEAGSPTGYSTITGGDTMRGFPVRVARDQETMKERVQRWAIEERNRAYLAEEGFIDEDVEGDGYDATVSVAGRVREDDDSTMGGR